MERLRQDLIFAQRSLRRSPLFALAAILTLALGVGATTTMFSVVHGVLLKPLPYPGQDRLLAGAMRWDDRPHGWNPMSKPDVLDLGDIPGLESVVGYATGSDVILEDGTAALYASARVTSGILAAFGLKPALGRDILPDESEPGAPHVLLLGYGLWQQAFGSDPGVLNRTLEVNGVAFQVVGVAPEGFDFPRQAQLWRPSVIDPEACGRGCRLYDVVARMVPGTNLDVVQDQVEALSTRLSAEFPDSNANRGIVIRSMMDRVVGDVRGQLWTLLGAVGLVLLVACANVANLLLARAQTRIVEMRIRASLGASRLRMLAQMLTESLVLAGLGGGAGLLLALLATAGLRRFGPQSIPRLDQVSLDFSAVLFTLGLILMVAVIFGLSPAVHMIRSSHVGPTRDSGRGQTLGRPAARFRQLLVALEMALSVILLVGSGLLLRSLYQVNRVDPGYRVQDVLRFSLDLPDEAYPELGQVSTFYTQLEDRIAGLPGVQAVGSGYGVPLGRWGTTGEVLRESVPDPEAGEEHWASLRPITSGYFQASGIPVLRGRGIQRTDHRGERPVAVVNQAFVRENFPETNPIGQRVRITVDMGFGSPWWTIVGVVPDLHTWGPTEGYSPEIFVPHAQMGQRAMTVVIHHAGDGPPSVATLQSIVRELDPTLPLRYVETMDQLLASETVSTRFYLVLLTLFSILAVILAAVGLYGVVAYLVSTRRQEIGVRLALGAEGVGIVRMVLLQAAVPSLGGLAAGVLGALALARVFQEFLFRVTPRDPWVFGGVVLILSATALASALIPARRASLVSPADSLREE